MGDPAGIGPDVILACWHTRRLHRLWPFLVYGDPDVMRERARMLGLDIPVAALGSMVDAGRVFDDALPVYSTAAAGQSASARGQNATIVGAIEKATAAVAGGDALALVTGPIAKKSLQSMGLEYPGHTAFLGQLAARYCGGGPYRPTMMLVADELKVVPTTVHIPLSAVASALSRTLVAETLRITAAALMQDFGIARPRLAVAGLNPHAGEGGLIGDEEGSVIAPAIAEVAASGVAVSGPYSADTLFHAEARATYDAVVAMYHDQALIPLKTLAFDRGVNVTLGLPFVRTSPDHGTAFALAGTGKARPTSFIAALHLAAKLGQQRFKTRPTGST
jgi:4-hydroxythreonine-4-phosphate dehydrogenase